MLEDKKVTVQRSDDVQSERDGVQSERDYAEKLLIDRIFVGDYQEKRYVSKLNAYKDLIVVNKHEKILCDDLVKMKNHLINRIPSAWIGFTEPNDIGAPAVYCIWTHLDSQNRVQMPGTTPEAASIVFGEYWFQIKGIRYGVNSIEICVSVLRPVDPTSSMSSSATISTLAQQALEIDTTKIQQYVQENFVDVDWIMLFHQWRTSFHQKVYHFCSTEITWNNFINCIRLLGVLSIAFLKFSVQFVHSLGEFTLKLMFELNRLVKTASPIVLALISLISKMIGGFYILLAMIWRDLFGNGDNNRNPNAAQLKNNFGSSSYSRAPIPYRENSRSTYTPAYSRRPTTSSRYQSNM